MEKAILKDKIIYASDVKINWSYEKYIRECSSKGLLRCPDKSCDSTILKYCHGNIKKPYFAHKYASSCDYDKYDKQNTTIVNNIKFLLFTHLSKKEIHVDIDVKISEHQYSHLVVYEADNKFAIELVEDSITARKINKLISIYEYIGQSVSLIVVGFDSFLQNESDANFIRRYSLNETENNELLIIKEDGSEIYQYKLDLFQYVYCGNNIFEHNSIYCEKMKINNLTFENGRLTIEGFTTRYNAWFEEKQAKYKDFLTPKIVNSNEMISDESSFNTSDERKKDITPIELEFAPKKISELYFIKNISISLGTVKLRHWNEQDFIEKIKMICYKQDEVEFKHLVIKFRTADDEEKKIINKLWLQFKNEREDYFYILKTANKKSKNNQT